MNTTNTIITGLRQQPSVNTGPMKATAREGIPNSAVGAAFVASPIVNTYAVMVSTTGPANACVGQLADRQGGGGAATNDRTTISGAMTLRPRE